MQEAVVVSVGDQAIDTQDKMIILFGESATDALKKVSVIQQFTLNNPGIKLEVGKHIYFDGVPYSIAFVGHLAEESLNSIGHVTLVFTGVPTEDSLGNAIYLSSDALPEISKGTVISYE